MPRKPTPVQKTSPVQEHAQTGKAPMVFISHDSRDADIAEAFSSLLKSVSAGILKSFRSSDKKGTQGIEYGTEWYPTIMSKIDDATDVVCLLTQNSVDRPWILYEAGVAKGKLEITVLGIAIGIELNVATNGPFAQFQNCDDDESSLTKLVSQLVSRMPGAEPDTDIIKMQVGVFREKIKVLLANRVPINPEDVLDDTDSNNPAKLFEEIKVMFNDLPDRIERKSFKERPEQFDNEFVFMDMLEFAENAPPEIAINIILSILRSPFPWLYDLGREALLSIKSRKASDEKNRVLQSFFKVMGMTSRLADRRNNSNYRVYRHAFSLLERKMHSNLTTGLSYDF